VLRGAAGSEHRAAPTSCYFLSVCRKRWWIAVHLAAQATLL